MNIFKAYFSGLKESVRLPRPVFLIYGINLLLALLIVFPLYSIANQEIGNSLNINNLLENFSAHLFSDFFRESGDSLFAVFSQIKWIVLIYWLLSVFFAGGIIRTLNQDKFSMASFFHGAGQNFFKFLGISLSVLIFHALIILIIYVPAGFIISSFSAITETAIVYTLGVAFTIHAFFIVLLFAVNDYSKFYSVLHNRNSLRSIIGGFRYVFKNFGKAYFLYLFLLIIPFFTIYGYFRLDAEVGTQTKNGVIAVFFIQQALILLRIWFRIWIYASPLQMFSRDYKDYAEARNEIERVAKLNEEISAQKHAPANQENNSEESETTKQKMENQK
ncbi:MAG: hypothetical protein U9N85_00795 [Bacteroidota bacterium]|nr:hypothetical protein [Bacteroidota bacterium]